MNPKMCTLVLRYVYWLLCENCPLHTDNSNWKQLSPPQPSVSLHEGSSLCVPLAQGGLGRVVCRRLALGTFCVERLSRQVVAELLYFEGNIIHGSRTEEKRAGRGRSLPCVGHGRAAVFISSSSRHFALCRGAFHLFFR